ncbi:hypothetical protein [Streptomyces sp. NPDC018055]|uniref:hypothetical protein n=1 Tax=Streptomyces sp. NPDC018055 TaxID=3365038 RepID=UPI0037B32F78
MDATYSAQSYFEAAKSAEFWSRVIVFIPALISAFAGVLSAVYAVKLGGSISAMAGAIAATASFMGSSKQVSSFKESARKYTALRHAAQLEISLLSSKTEQEREEIVRVLSDMRSKIVATDDPVPNRFFEKASRRIDSGVTSYAAASE